MSVLIMVILEEEIYKAILLLLVETSHLTLFS